MILKELTKEEFNKFTNKNNSSLYQTLSYAEVMNKQKYECLFYGLLDNNIIYGASLILVKKIHGFKYAFAPRGLICDYSNRILIKDFTDLLKKELSKRNIVALRISPSIIKSINIQGKKEENKQYNKIFENLKNCGFNHLGYGESFDGIKSRFEAIINLNDKPNNLFKKISKNFKTKIRSADNNGIMIFKGNEENLDTLFIQTKNKYPRDLKYFKDIYYHFNQNNNIEIFYSKLNTSEYVKNIQYKYQRQMVLCNNANDLVFKNVKKNNQKNIQRKLAEESKLESIKNELIYATKLLKDYPDGIITASVLIIKNKKEVFMLMDGYDKTYKRLNSKHLLLWKLIEKYAKEGFKTFNLGGIGNFNIKNSKYQGLNDFKLSFGATAVEYAGDFELIIKKALYIMYKNSSSVLGILKK